jgi:hypothetical protein
VSIQATTKGWVRLPNGNLIDAGYFESGWQCSGFVVNPEGWVATAGHCATGAEEAILVQAVQAIVDGNVEPARLEGIDPTKLQDAPALMDVAVSNWRVEGEQGGSSPQIDIAVLSGSGDQIDTQPAEVVEATPLDKGDVALLRVHQSDMPSTQLGADADVAIGTAVLAVGYPASTEMVTDPTLDPTSKSGKISKKSTSGTVPVYEMDAAISEGMSGGPTIALDGKVLGINSFKPTGETQAFNFIAPSSILSDMMSNNGVEATLGPTDTAYRDGLTNYFAGNYTAAIEDFDDVLAASPDYPGVTDLKQEAAKDRDQYGDAAPAAGSSNLKWFVIGGVIAALVVAGLLAVLLRGRRGGATPAAAPAGTGPAGAAPSGDAAPGTGAAQSASTNSPPSASLAGGQPPHTGPTETPTSGPPESAQRRFCSQCGTANEYSAKFCRSCGKPV